MKPRNFERENAMRAGQMTYVDKHPHIDQKTKQSCGTFIRYAKTGKCVACARSGARVQDDLAPAGERLLLRDVPKSERMEVAVKTYAESDGVSIMRCAFLFSLNNQDLGLELKRRGLTRAIGSGIDKTYSQLVDNKEEKLFKIAMQAFAPARQTFVNTRGDA